MKSGGSDLSGGAFPLDTPLRVLPLPSAPGTILGFLGLIENAFVPALGILDSSSTKLPLPP